LTKKRLIPVVVVAAVAALVLVLTTSGGTSKAHKNAAATTSSVNLRSTSLGKILVDGEGRTLYLFEADKRGMSNCSGACLSLWPVLSSQGKPHAGPGVTAAKLGTTTTSGKQQVTYNGHPLYYYAGDQKAGDTSGQGLNQFGAKWYVLAATGNKIDND
jgi:predicted lipoprotein with Yx(FWY)xxD motif